MSSLHGGTEPLAALTTVFTPPCSTSWLVTTTKLPSQFPSFPSAGPTTCDPPEWAANLAGEGFQYYSPAICPDGFQVGEECLVASATPTGQGFPAVDAGETVAWCVPDGHTCTSDTTDFRGGIWGVSRTASDVSAVVTVGPALQIRWKDSDLSLLATHPLTPGLVLATTTSASAADAATTPPRSPPPIPITVAPVPPASLASSEASDGDDASSTENSSGAGFVTVTGQSTISPAPAAGTTSTRGTSTARSSTRAVSPASTPTTSAGTAGQSSATDADTGVAGPVTKPVSGTGTSSSSSSTAGATGGVGASQDEKEKKRVVIATAIMASVLGVMAVGLGIFIFWVRRRRRLRRQHAGTLFAGETGQPETSSIRSGSADDALSGSERSGSSSATGWSSLTTVGIGAWVRRPKAWLRSEWWLSRWQAWTPPLAFPSPFPFSLARGRQSQSGSPVSRRHMHMDLPSTLWRRQQQRNEEILRQFRRPHKQQRSAQESASESPSSEVDRTYDASPEQHHEGLVDEEAFYASQEKTDVRIQITSASDPQPISAAADTATATASASKSEQRWSWMSRLARDMRGRSASSASSPAPPDTPVSPNRPRSNVDMSDAASSRPTSASTSRWSRLTEAVDYEASWETFSKAQGGAAKLVFLARARQGETSRGLTVPDMMPIPRQPSPTATMRSSRASSARTSGNGSRARSVATIRDSNNRLSRLSDGTFGRFGSVISRDSQLQEKSGQASPI